MTYRVLWTPHAESQFERIVHAAKDQELVASAAREIDQSLAVDPTDYGESRYENVRIGFAHPLGVQFEILDDVHTVIVFEVWRTARP